MSHHQKSRLFAQQKLIEGTRVVSKRQLDRPIEIESSEELAELAHSFNPTRRVTTKKKISSRLKNPTE